MAANNLGTAYIKIAPQMEGIQGAITKGLQSAAKSSVAGATALGTVVAKGVSTALNAVTNSMDRAISRVDTLNAFPKIMKNLGFSTEESTSAIEKLSNRIEGLPTGLDEIVNYTQRLASTLGNLNKDVYNATNLAIAFNDAALAGGKGQYEANRAFEQFSQVLSRGRPSMQDWKIMMEVMPGQLKQMARYMGSNNKSLQEYAKNAKKTVDQLDGMDLYNWISENKNEKAKERLQDLTKALIDLDNEGGAGITSFKEQVGDATHTIGNALRLIPLRISKGIAAIVQAFGSQDIYSVIDKFSSSFGKVADWIIKYMVPPIKNYVIPALKTVFGAIANIFKMIGENETASKILAGVIYAFVGFKAIKSVFPIIKTAGTVVGNLASKLNIFKGAQTLGNGIGSIVASILKPLGSTEVLKGAASAALVAGGIWAFADGIAKVSSAYIDWGKVALMEVNMAAITAVIAAIGALAGTGAIIGGVATAVISGGLWVFATALADLTLKLEVINWEGIYALTGHIAVISTILSSIVALEALGAVGSIADAIIGGGLLVAAAGLAKASEIADSIDVDKISRLSFVVAEVSIVLGALVGLEAFGAVGAICDMVISGGLLVSAIALQETQNHVNGLNAKTFQKLTDCLGQVSSALAIASTWSWAGAIGAIFNDAIDGGVLVAALALEEAKKHIDGLDAGTFQKFTDCLGQVSGALAIAATWSWASAISAIFNDAIAGGLLVATAALEESSKHVRKIKEEDYQKLSRVFKEISSWETGGILSSFQKMVASNELTAVAWNIKNTLDAFAQMGEAPDEEKINKLKSAIENLSRIEVHGSGLFENKGAAAQELEWIVSNIVSISHKLSEIPQIKYNRISNFVDCLKLFDRIDDKARDGIKRLSDLGDSLGNIDWIKKILGDIPKEIGDNVQKFVNAIKKFNQIDDGTRDGVRRLKDLGDSLSNIDWIKKILGDVPDSIGNNVDKFVSAIKKFNDIDQGTRDGIRKLKDLGDSLGNISWIKAIIGDIPDSIGGNVDKFVQAIKRFNDIDEDARKGIRSLNDLGDGLGNIDWIKHIIGDIPDSIGNNVDSFVKAIKKFNDIDEGTRKSVRELNNLGDSLGNIDWLKKILGDVPEGMDKNIGGFVNAIKKFGEIDDNARNGALRLKNMGDSLGNIDWLKHILGDMPEDIYGKVQWFVDSIKLFDRIDENARAGVLRLASLSDSLGNIDWIKHILGDLPTDIYGKVQWFVDAIKLFDRIDENARAGVMRLASLGDALGNIDWIKYILGDVPADLPTRAQYIVDALNKLAGFNAQNISFESISTAVATLLNAIKQALVNGHQLMVEAGKQLAYKVRDGIVSDLDALMQAGKNIQSAFWVAIESKLNDEYHQGRALANHVKDGINSIINSGELQRSGVNAGNGLINGLKSTYFTAYNAGRNLASKLIQGIKDRGAEGSPWKTTFQSGIFAGQGLAEGLLAAKDDVVDAATVIADATQDALGLNERGFDVGGANTHLLPQTALTSGMNGTGGQVIQNNEFYVDSELDVKDVSKRLGWQVATAL